jgi:hypothetical protein
LETASRHSVSCSCSLPTSSSIWVPFNFPDSAFSWLCCLSHTLGPHPRLSLNTHHETPVSSWPLRRCCEVTCPLLDGFLNQPVLNKETQLRTQVGHNTLVACWLSHSTPPIQKILPASGSGYSQYNPWAVLVVTQYTFWVSSSALVKLQSEGSSSPNSL